MKERIKEFRFKAAEYANEQIPLGITKWNEMRDEKFAELLVQECAEQIKTQGISASSEGYGDYEIGFNAGLFHALYTTQKHFGVN